MENLARGVHPRDDRHGDGKRTRRKIWSSIWRGETPVVPFDIAASSPLPTR
jgi:hypothetical protein